MTTAQIQSSVLHLASLRANGLRDSRLPYAPVNDAEAYAIQDGVTLALGAAVGAWKAGMRPDGVGNCAPIYAADLYATPAVVPAEKYGVLGIEAEIAFRIGRDLPRRSNHYSVTEIMDAVSEMLVAIEIVNHRFTDVDAVTPLEKLADNQANGGLVVNHGRSDWTSIDRMSVPAALTVGGKVVHDGLASNPVGDPIGPLLWIVNHLTIRNGGLRAGQVVTCGSCTGLVTAARGDDVVADFGPLGSVLLRLAA